MARRPTSPARASPIPTAPILSVAMLLRHSLQLEQEAQCGGAGGASRDRRGRTHARHRGPIIARQHAAKPAMRCSPRCARGKRSVSRPAARSSAPSRRPSAYPQGCTGGLRRRTTRTALNAARPMIDQQLVGQTIQRARRSVAAKHLTAHISSFQQHHQAITQQVRIQAPSSIARRRRRRRTSRFVWRAT